MIALPGYVDKEAWDGFVQMRGAMKKPLTPRAAKLVLYELQRLKDAGHDPNASLDQSTNHCWADVYMVKEKPVEFCKASEAEKTSKYLAERAEQKTDSVVAAEALQRARNSLKRVA